MAQLHDYNFAHCVVLVDGVPVEGFKGDDGVEIEYESEVWTSEVGADGDVVRSATNDRRATITFHLSETSPLNAFFRNKVNLARVAGLGDTFSFFLKDLHTNETVTAPDCWVQTDPGISKGREAGEREWVCMAADLTILGG